MAGFSQPIRYRTWPDGFVQYWLAERKHLAVHQFHNKDHKYIIREEMMIMNDTVSVLSCHFSCNVLYVISSEHVVGREVL